MPLTTAPDVFVSAPLARHRHRAVKEERETQMAPRNETVGTENSAIGNKRRGKMAQ